MYLKKLFEHSYSAPQWAKLYVYAIANCAMRNLNFTQITQIFSLLKIPQLVSENVAVTNCTKQES